MPIIEVDHVSKEFQLGELEGFRTALSNRWRRLRGQPVEHRPLFKALDDISFSVEPGEVLGIIGHNGAGKSTLLKLLAGISKPSSGRIEIHGKVAPLIEVGAGFVGQLTGRENVYLNGAILGLTKREIDRKFDQIVDFAEMEEFIDTPVKRYSSGMRIKLAFSVATSIDAEILIVDEVLAVGDLAFQRKCFDRMESLIKRDGRTVLLVSHNIRQVERMCSRVLFMDHGRIRHDGAARVVCNAFYEYSDERISAQSGKARKRVKASTGEVELADLILVDSSGETVSTTAYRNDLLVRFEIIVHKPLRQPIFVVGIHTTDFIKVSTTTSLETFRGRILESGRHQFLVRLHDCPLNPGSYSFRLSIDVEDPIRNILYGDSLSPFTVHSKELSRSGPDLEGFFRMRATWQEVLEENTVRQSALANMGDGHLQTISNV